MTERSAAMAADAVRCRGRVPELPTGPNCDYPPPVSEVRDLIRVAARRATY